MEIINFILSGLWKLAPGVLASAIVLLVDKRYPHIWHRWRFRNREHSDRLVGQAFPLHSLVGQKRSDSAGGNPKDDPESLDNEFPPPKKDDALKYDLDNVSITVNPSRETLFKGIMNYVNSGETISAEVVGTGEFIYKDETNFDGYVYLNCKMTAISPANRKGLEWTVSCCLKRDSNNRKWNGFWLLFDRQDPKFANFGVINLNPAAAIPKKNWFKGISKNSPKSYQLN